MTDINKLKEEELNQLNKVEVEEVSLEELIVLGDDKKIPIHITYPNADGTTTNAKALIKQLTLKEISTVQNQKNLLQMSLLVLQKAFFKSTGEPFSKAELQFLPVGVANAISNKILELSGVDKDTSKNIADF